MAVYQLPWQINDPGWGAGQVGGMGVKQVTVFAAVAAAMALASCSVGPDFATPTAPETERYTPEPLRTTTSSAPVADGAAQRFLKGRDVSGEWWRLYGSRPLTALIRRALDANPNLQATMAALRVANEDVYAQQGKFFPLIQGNFNPSRQSQSSALAPVLAASNPTFPVLPGPAQRITNPFNLVTSQLTIAYTLDVWGQNQRAVESLQAQADFQHFQIEAAYLTLTSNVVVTAILEASLRAQIQATERIIGINTQLLKRLRDQFAAGYANRSDVAVQEANLAQVQATLPPLRKQLAFQRNLLAALLGVPPSAPMPEVFRLTELRLPTDLPVSLPSQLIQQRPDVRSAEEQLHSASAQVGVAIANQLPNFTISGSRGYTASDLAALVTYFSHFNLFWSVAGNATQTLFDGFSLEHQKRAAIAAYDQAAWSYRATVIGALQNVADALRALQNDADAVRAAAAFERAAKVSLDVAQEQFNSGNINVLLLLTQQQAYQQAVIALVQAQANRLIDTAALYAALGGGWWNRIEPLVEKKYDVSAGQPVPAEFRLNCGFISLLC
jgi:NodT family efflux transporter outer membrane factor (OMF) lipoprotein